jgi:hypothetical protein
MTFVVIGIPGDFINVTIILSSAQEILFKFYVSRCSYDENIFSFIKYIHNRNRITTNVETFQKVPISRYGHRRLLVHSFFLSIQNTLFFFWFSFLSIVPTYFTISQNYFIFTSL